MTTDDTDRLYEALRRGAAVQNDHRRAAVELLIQHEHWLHRGDFARAALTDEPDYGEALIHWDQAADFLDSGPRGSTSELAVLRLAVALAQDMFDFGVMGQGHRAMIRQALGTALGDSNTARTRE